MIDIRYKNGYGWINQDGTICATRCFDCGRENYALAVSTGCCAKCGVDFNSIEYQNKNPQIIDPGVLKNLKKTLPIKTE